MQTRYARTSLILLGVSILLLIALTVLEPALVGAPRATERTVTVLALVLPAGAGCVFGAMSLVRREGKSGLALTGFILNGAFALFHLAIVLLAG